MRLELFRDQGFLVLVLSTLSSGSAVRIGTLLGKHTVMTVTHFSQFLAQHFWSNALQCTVTLV